MWSTDAIRIFAKLESNRICLPAICTEISQSNLLRNDLFLTWKLLYIFLNSHLPLFLIGSCISLCFSNVFHSNWMTEIWILKLLRISYFAAMPGKIMTASLQREFSKVIFLNSKQSYLIRSLRSKSHSVYFASTILSLQLSHRITPTIACNITTILSDAQSVHGQHSTPYHQRSELNWMRKIHFTDCNLLQQEYSWIRGEITVNVLLWLACTNTPSSLTYSIAAIEKAIAKRTNLVHLTFEMLHTRFGAFNEAPSILCTNVLHLKIICFCCCFFIHSLCVHNDKDNDCGYRWWDFVCLYKCCMPEKMTLNTTHFKCRRCCTMLYAFVSSQVYGIPAPPHPIKSFQVKRHDTKAFRN